MTIVQKMIAGSKKKPPPPGKLSYMRALHQPVPSADQFGRALAICDEFLLVGVPYDEDAGHGSGSGRAYLYSTTDWELVHSFTNPNTPGNSTTSDYFGYSVAVSDQYSLIGAIQEDSPTSNQGYAYLFDNITGQLVHAIAPPSEGQSNAYFGAGVGLNATYMAVGMPNATYSSGLYNGKCKVYRLSDGVEVEEFGAGGTSNYYGWDLHLTEDNELILGGPGDLTGAFRFYPDCTVNADSIKYSSTGGSYTDDFAKSLDVSPNGRYVGVRISGL